MNYINAMEDLFHMLDLYRGVVWDAFYTKREDLLRFLNIVNVRIKVLLILSRSIILKMFVSLVEERGETQFIFKKRC